MPNRTKILLVSLALISTGMPQAAAQSGDEVTNGEVYARITDERVVLGNSVVERAWTTTPFGTEYAVDKRTGLTTGASVDLRLGIEEGVELTGADFAITSVRTEEYNDGGLSVVMELAGPAEIANVVRTVTVYPGIAGFEVRTLVEGAAVLSRYVLDELALPDAAPEVHSFRAGYDWRGSDTPDWAPAVSPFGGHHSGDHRVTTTGDFGESVEEEGEWMSLSARTGERIFFVLERVDYPSSRMSYDGNAGGPVVDLHHDLLYAGPFESDVHVGNPNEAPIRYRQLLPGQPLDLEPVFSGFASDADDEPWQHHKYLVEHRAPDWDREVVFNSNGVDGNRISTGAKDDMDMAEVVRQADVARRIGVETFVLDDGWQAASGDWCPDSPQCPEPRGLFPPRFPDATFAGVRDELGTMDLGLWMSPMHFNPAAEAYGGNPQWNCEPVGEALVAFNRAQPDSSSNEAGLGTWNPEATGPDGRLIDYIEGKIRLAIEEWDVEYFKFDFLVWLDCLGVEPVTMYDYRESFIAMLDRLIADHPEVTFQIDETNDYRMFPFESVARGPSWYANGHPKASEALHNLWVLNPYVPGYTIGQAVYGQRDSLPSDYLMAVALGSHMTFFTDLTTLTEEQVDTATRWVEIYKEHRDRLATFTYPLLEDPIAGDNWTALQPWDPDTGRGALLVYRQDSSESSKMVALRGVRGDGDFRLLDAVTGETFDVVAADQLRSGIEISLPERFSARVLLIEPADQTEETATSLRYVGDTEAKGATVDLAAILTDAQGAPVEGRTVTFSLLGRVLVASTDASGRAAVIATIEDHGRTAEVTTSFAGDAVYGPSTTTATIVWGKKPVG